jgi:SNF2 family DNA or RNA helicase
MMPLWAHQREAVDFAVARKATLWHMGMGTGKSRCAIEVAKRLGISRVLILCPLSVVSGWQEQLRQYGPDFEAVPLSKGTVRQKTEHAKERLSLAHAMGKKVVVIVNYESARNEPLAGMLMKQGFDLLVLDESHRIKSPQGTTSRWVSRLAKTCGTRVALTGTPMPHSPLDVYAQFRALDPALFGLSFVRFRARYAKMGGYGMKQVVGYQNMAELQGRLAAYTYQADRSVLDLPDALHQRLPITLGAKARKLYTALDNDFVAAVREGEITATNALVKLLRLQQLTSGWVTAEADEDRVLVEVDTAKRDALADLLEDLPSNEPVVVFGRFSADLRAAHSAAARCKRKSLELSGARRELEAWQAGQATVLAVQIQSGGTGIDLTRARYCVYLSAGYSLGDYEQSLARVHRPGQSRSVVYYHLVAENTVDEKVYQALRDRKQVVESVLAGISEPQTDKDTNGH